MRNITEVRRAPDTLSATVVRNILSKVRSFSRRNLNSDRVFYFRHGRYHIMAILGCSRCQRFVVSLHHREFWETWLIEPCDYSLLPSEAFDL